MLCEALRERGYLPQFGIVDLEHVTFSFPVGSGGPFPLPPPAAKTAEIVGHVLGDGIECFVVKVNGSKRRPDGGVYHLTYSYSEGHQPAEANEAIARFAAAPVVPSMWLTLDPRRLI